MKSFGQVLDLKNDPKTIETYKKYHREVWPEVVRSLKTAGISKIVARLVPVGVVKG